MLLHLLCALTVKGARECAQGSPSSLQGLSVQPTHTNLPDSSDMPFLQHPGQSYKVATSKSEELFSCNGTSAMIIFMWSIKFWIGELNERK